MAPFDSPDQRCTAEAVEGVRVRSCRYERRQYPEMTSEGGTVQGSLALYVDGKRRRTTGQKKTERPRISSFCCKVQWRPPERVSPT